MGYGGQESVISPVLPDGSEPVRFRAQGVVAEAPCPFLPQGALFPSSVRFASPSHASFPITLKHTFIMYFSYMMSYTLVYFLLAQVSCSRAGIAPF